MRLRMLFGLAFVIATMAGFCQGMPFRERIRLLELTQTRLMHLSDQPVPKVTYGNRMMEAVSVAQMSDHLLHLAVQPKLEDQHRQLEETAWPLSRLVSEYRSELESLKYDWELTFKYLRTWWTRIICIFPDEDDFLAELTFGKSEGYEAKLMSREAIEEKKAYELMLPSAKQNHDKFRSYLNLVNLLEK